MWIFIQNTQEYIPVNERLTKKVFRDAQRGWCVLQNSGEKYYISEEQKKDLENEFSGKQHEHHPKDIKELARKVMEIIKAKEEDS